MELIPYSAFGQLRLRDFCGSEVEESDTADWEWMGGVWFCEGVGFTTFVRLHDMPAETGGLEMDLAELPSHISSRILDQICLPLEKGSSFEMIREILGEPLATETFVEDRKTYDFLAGAVHPYLVSCTVLNEGGLTFVSVIRGDVLSRIANA